MGKKVPLLETTSVVGGPSTSSQNVQAVSFCNAQCDIISMCKCFFGSTLLWHIILLLAPVEETLVYQLLVQHHVQQRKLARVLIGKIG